jgi:hypothetical protein
MALIFACCRDLARMDRAVRGGVWDPLESMQLNGKTLGLIGLGGIGREVARIARGVGMEVIGWNRSARPDVDVPLVGLDELLARADVISLHLALNDETRGFIDAKRLARAKRGVILVNTARGALVEERALLDALASGHVRHAGFDVFHAEPLKPDHPLARMENVTLTSHAAFRTLEASETLMRRAIDIVRGIVAPSSPSHQPRSCGVCASADVPASNTPVKIEQRRFAAKRGIGNSIVRGRQAKSCRTALSFLPQRVQIAHQALEALLEHMGINLRRGDVGVAEQRLHHPKVGAVVQEMTRESVAEHVRADLA